MAEQSKGFLTCHGRIIYVSNGHGVMKSFIWSEQLPIGLAARDAAAAFDEKVKPLDEDDHTGWTLEDTYNGVLAADLTVGEALFNGASTKLINLERS